MRAVIKNGIGIFSPQGFLDGNNSSILVTFEDIEATKKLNADIILVSLKKVIFFNRNGLDIFVKLFTKIRKDKHITVGFCDYDEKKFNAIKNFYANDLNFSLFQTKEIAELFSPTYSNDKRDVLIYTDDKSQNSAIAIELHDNGHNPILAQSKQDFLNKKNNFDYVISNSILGCMGNSVATRVTGNAIIYTISTFLDAEIGNKFNIAYHNNSLNIGFKLFIFDAYKVVSMNIHALNFFSKLASYSAEYNATICFAGLSSTKFPESFKETLEDSGIMFFNQMDDILNDEKQLKELTGVTSVNTKNKRHINKATVSELPNLIDATVATIEMMTNAKALKESVNIQEVTLKNHTDMVASSIGFYGDLDGMIILVFPIDIAKKTCELLIGEETDDTDMILDTLSELVNIVGGKMKTILSDENVNINITLPRTYQKISTLLENTKGRKGVQVDLAFDGKKFLFFLTR